MITKNNADLYRELFEQANARLKTFGVKEGTEEDSPYVTIESIEEYFAHIKDIILGTSTRPATKEEIEEGYYFLRLPLDEPTIIIDANTRQISKKTKDGKDHPFFKNGFSVQGDEVAETVYFEIDRFYDATDLSRMLIAIQWIHENDLKGQHVQYNYTPIIIKDIESVDGKLIFGWPIGVETTLVPGKIHFSIRFYHLDAENEVDYSFSTQPTVGIINPTILADVRNESVEIDNKIDLILGRLENSIFGGVADAAVPFYVLFSPELPNGNDVLSEEIDKDIVLYALAQKIDSGTLAYKWIRVSEVSDSNSNETTTTILRDFTTLNNTEIPNASGYLEIPEWNKNIRAYYYLDDNGEYQVETIVDEQQFNDFLKQNNNKLYAKCATFVLRKADVKPGKIYVDVQNKYYNSISVLSESDNNLYSSKYWEIAGPVAAEIVSNLNKHNKYNENLNLVVTANNITENSECKWYYKDPKESEQIYTINTTLGEAGLTFHPHRGEGYYWLEISNKKNNGEKITSTEEAFVYNDLKTLTSQDLACEISEDKETEYVRITLKDIDRDSTYEKIKYEWSIGLKQNTDISDEDIIDRDAKSCVLPFKYSSIIESDSTDDIGLSAQIKVTIFKADGNNAVFDETLKTEAYISQILYFSKNA